MKKVILLVIVIFIFITHVPKNPQSQWLSEVRLTNNTGNSLTSFNNASSVAASGNTVHVAWADDRNNNNFEIYYKRSTDGGLNWGSDMRLSNAGGESRFPSITVSSQIIHVAWREGRHPNNFEIYYIRSTDGGLTWGAEVRLSNTDRDSYYPSLASSGSDIHIAWCDGFSANWDIYFKHSTDSGVSWGPNVRLTTNDSLISFDPSLAVFEQFVHIMWYDYRDGNSELYYKRSTDAGTTWEADMRMTNEPSESRYPSISAQGMDVHAVWNDHRSGNWKIYYIHSTDNGLSWGENTRLTDNPAFSEFPSVAISGMMVHTVWFDLRDGDWEIYYKRSTDRGASWEADTRLTNSQGFSWYPSVTTSDRGVHVVWFDYRDLNNEIYYKLDSTGNITGTQNISTEIPNEYALHQNYPNPFNPSTNIKFRIPAQGFVSLRVFDVLGREGAELVNEQLNPGIYEVNWNAANYTSGVYFYRLVTQSYSETRKMALVK